MIIIRDPVFSMVIDNRYRVGEKITNGGYGQVFKIFDVENNFFLFGEMICSCIQARSAAVYVFLAKPISNIVLMFKLLQNGLLSLYLEDKPTIDFKLRLTWFEQMLSALKYLKEKNLIHRDIKTQYILKKSFYASYSAIN